MHESHSNIDKSQTEQAAKSTQVHFSSMFLSFLCPKKKCRTTKKGSQYRGLQCTKLVTTHVVFKTATNAIHSYTVFWVFFFLQMLKLLLRCAHITVILCPDVFLKTHRLHNKAYFSLQNSQEIVFIYSCFFKQIVILPNPKINKVCILRQDFESEAEVIHLIDLTLNRSSNLIIPIIASFGCHSVFTLFFTWCLVRLIRFWHQNCLVRLRTRSCSE